MASSKQPKKDPATKVCPACDGRKTVSFGTDDVKCGRCKGKGTIKA